MTMEHMRLEKIGVLLERAKVARETRKDVPAPLGRLPANEAEAIADVKKRAADHVARAFGMRVNPDDVAVEKDGKKFVASMKTDNGLYPFIKLTLENPSLRKNVADGDQPGVVIKHVVGPPIVNNDDVRDVRDRFMASLLSQVFVHGRVHGDPHKGNWGLMADGKTIVMLDFGKMIDLRKKHLAAPLQVAWNWYRRDPEGMADAILSMSTHTGKAKSSDARPALVDALKELQKSAQSVQGDKARIGG